MTTPLPSARTPRTNRLSFEKSPYLLQHQHNPVDWQPWGGPAFAQAQEQNKPIFLSIGYSTCHWCHVMERESFESEAAAKFLNEHFVSIKVDREERPDVDKIYMTFVQSTSGGGGWPLNCFLTPELKPFFGGTYFPPEPRHGRPGFLELLKQITHLWQTRRQDVAQSAMELHERLAAMATGPAAEAGEMTSEVLDRAAALFKQTFDPRHGGFGDAPKFPQPSQPAFLLRHGMRTGDAEAVRMVMTTCDRMAAGGIYDQLGGGFSRYSVDAQWLVPHFEKMLYDNAQLVNLYLDAYLAGGGPRCAQTARDIIRYILRDMTHPGGGFYSAEDADSEGKEGKFYCWTCAELSRLLTVEEFNVASRYYGITEQGNFLDHSDPDALAGQNVLSIGEPELPEADKPLLASANAKMFAERSKRVRPHLDDKVLASWNGLMLGAMARAYAVLGDETFRVAAEKNFSFLREKLWDETTGTLYHRWRDGERDAVQLQHAYAFLLGGVVDLYEATLEPEYLSFAVALADAMRTRFEDTVGGGFWQSAAGESDLIMRVKEDYDGAEPSGNSVATLALFKLAAITDRADYRKSAEGGLRFAAERLRKFPQALPYMLLALDFSLEEPRRVVIAGDPSRAATRAFLRAAHSVYQPSKVVLGTIGPVEAFAKTLAPQGTATAYVCTGTACQPPTNAAEQLRELLK